MFAPRFAQSEMQQRARELLAAKSTTAAVGQMVLFATYAFATAVYGNAQLTLLGFCAVGFIANVLRIWVARRALSWPTSSRFSWQFTFSAVLIGIAASWGLLCADAILSFGINHTLGVFAILITGAVSAAATSSLVPAKRLGQMFLSIIIGLPVIAILIRHTAPELLLGSTFVLYFIQLYSLVRQHCDAHDVSLSREQQYEALAHASFEAIAIHREGVVIEVNPAFLRTFRCEAHQVVGRKIFEFVPKEDVAEAAQSLLTDSLEPRKCRGLRADGTVFPMEAFGRYSTYLGQAVRLSCMRDMTSTFQAETALRESERAARESTRLKSDFLANMSHEIRTPLNAIIGFTDLLLEIPSSPVQRKYHRTLKDSGEALLFLVNDILDFSKIESGKIDFEKIDFNLVTMIEGQADLLAGKAAAKGLSLGVFVDPNLPELVAGDPGRIGQIILNLVGNAIKFTEHGSVVVHARREQADDTSVSVRIEVVDTGIGISGEALNRLFKPFVQADMSTARRYGGSGLGLCISRRLAQLMGGTISVESKEGAGSTFTVELPLEIVSRVTFTENKRKKSRELKDKLRILIVDDDPVASEIAAQYIRGWGWDATMTKREQFALSLRGSAPRTEADLLLLSYFSDSNPVNETVARFAEGQHEKDSMKIIVMGAPAGTEMDIAEKWPRVRAFTPNPIRQSELYDAIVTSIAQTRADFGTDSSLETRNPDLVAPATKSRRVLVVEDNPINQMLIVALLTRMGYACQAVSNGLEGVQITENNNFDLILMDCQMPEMDGLQATRLIREREARSTSHVPIVALTANALESDKEKCLDAGMDDYLSKPIRRAQLESVLKQWMGGDPATPRQAV